MRNIESQDFL